MEKIVKAICSVDCLSVGRTGEIPAGKTKENDLKIGIF